jgi:hypothetical protein
VNEAERRADGLVAQRPDPRTRPFPLPAVARAFFALGRGSTSPQREEGLRMQNFTR